MALRYRGKFISRARYNQLANLPNARKYLSVPPKDIRAYEEETQPTKPQIDYQSAKDPRVLAYGKGRVSIKGIKLKSITVVYQTKVPRGTKGRNIVRKGMREGPFKQRRITFKIDMKPGAKADEKIARIVNKAIPKRRNRETYFYVMGNFSSQRRKKKVSFPVVPRTETMEFRRVRHRNKKG